MKIKITALVLAFALVMCMGCSNSKSNTANGARGGNMQGANQRQQTVAPVSDEIKQSATKVVTGTVESIVGNEVTLLITSESSNTESAAQNSRGERGERPQMSGEFGNGERPQRSQRTEGERPQLPEGMTMPEGSMPQRRQRGERSNDGTSAETAAPKDAETKSTDTAKTVKYLLPVGMSMGSKDYSSVTAGNTLRIYFGSHPQDGSEIITAVEVVSGRR